MVSNTLAVARLASDDLDYEAAFRALCDVHSEMRRDGVGVDLLLRRAHCRFALGNFLGAAFDAERVVRERPGWTDALYVKGQACLAIAAVKEGILRPGVGVYMPPEGLPERKHILGVAERCFEAVLERQPEDTQAQRGLATVQAMRS